MRLKIVKFHNDRRSELAKGQVDGANGKLRRAQNMYELVGDRFTSERRNYLQFYVGMGLWFGKGGRIKMQGWLDRYVCTLSKRSCERHSGWVSSFTHHCVNTSNEYKWNQKWLFPETAQLRQGFQTSHGEMVEAGEKLLTIGGQHHLRWGSIGLRKCKGGFLNAYLAIIKDLRSFGPSDGQRQRHQNWMHIR